MQRASEMALDVAVDKYDWSIDCATHYTKNAPSSEKAMALADKGYYLLSCRGTNDRVLDAMEPYGKLTPFMHLLTFVGITLYFVTSSDSGSFVDDIISAQGHENPPWIQRIYWAVTKVPPRSVALRFGRWIEYDPSRLYRCWFTVHNCHLLLLHVALSRVETRNERRRHHEPKTWFRRVFVGHSRIVQSGRHAGAIAVERREVQIERHRVVLPVQRSQDRCMCCVR